jgi:hypothetical protein
LGLSRHGFSDLIPFVSMLYLPETRLRVYSHGFPTATITSSEGV